MKRLIILSLIVMGVVCGYVPAEAQQVAGSDQQVVTQSIQSTLEYNKTNQAATWTNPDTGHSGSTVPVRTFTDAAGQPCREFVTTIVIAGEEQQAYGTACRQPDGSWQFAAPPAADTSTVTAAPVEKRVYVYEPAPSYGYYPYGAYSYYPYGYYSPWGYGYPAYWPYPVSFSFGYSYYKSSYPYYYSAPYYRYPAYHNYSGYRGYPYRSVGYRGYGYPAGSSGFRSGGSYYGGQGYRSGGSGYRSGSSSFRAGGGGGRR